MSSKFVLDLDFKDNVLGFVWTLAWAFGFATATPRGGRTGGRIGRGGGRTRGRSGDLGNGKIDDQGGQVGGQVDNNQRGCTYKEFLACNSKGYDGKGGAIVYTRWIKNMEPVQDMSGCEAVVGMLWEDFKTLTREELYPSNEMQKLKTELWNHIMVEASHVAYTDRFHELASNGAKDHPKGCANSWHID
ncbi:hypothetical protein Tco_1313360 [Tanacetum coccineum]